MLTIFFQFLILTMRQNNFSLILNQDILILNLLWKQRLTKLFPFWRSLLIIVTILNTTIYHKSIYSGLLLNFNSFTSRFYKISLIKCLIDRAYDINNTWASFHNDVTKIKQKTKNFKM